MKSFEKKLIEIGTKRDKTWNTFYIKLTIKEMILIKWITRKIAAALPPKTQNIINH